MAFKLNISEKSGKTWKLELQDEVLVGRLLGEKIKGQELFAGLSGYELIISGASDISGFPQKPDVDGHELRRVLLKKGWGMHDERKGLRKKKTIRGKQLSDKTVQVNLIIDKEGAKKLSEIFPEQNKPKEKEKKVKEKTEETETQKEAEEEELEEKIAEEIAEEVEEEIKDKIPESPETKTGEQREEAAEKIAEEVKEEMEDVAEKIAEKEN